MGRARSFREKRVASKKNTPKSVALIVCEGLKTEPNYIREVYGKLKTASASIKLIGLGVDPVTVVSKAVDEFDKNPHFDRVYCVFDRDNHANYDQAVDRCKSIRKRNENGRLVRFCHITSWPSFEYWLLLHFTRSNAPMMSAGGRTAAQNAEHELKRYLPGYSKNSNNLLSLTEHLIARAASDAHRFSMVSEENPHTRFYRLVAFLASISSRNDLAWRQPLHDLAILCEEV